MRVWAPPGGSYMRNGCAVARLGRSCCCVGATLVSFAFTFAFSISPATAFQEHEVRVVVVPIVLGGNLASGGLSQDAASALAHRTGLRIIFEEEVFVSRLAEC